MFHVMCQYCGCVINYKSDRSLVVFLRGCGVCSDLSRVPQLRDSSRHRLKRFHIVLGGWVADCLGIGKLLDERKYQP